MYTVKVAIAQGDELVAGMVRGHAHTVGQQDAVSGATDKFLKEHGFLKFSFRDKEDAAIFKVTLEKYLPAVQATLLPE